MKSKKTFICPICNVANTNPGAHALTHRSKKIAGSRGAVKRGTSRRSAVLSGYETI